MQNPPERDPPPIGVGIFFTAGPPPPPGKLRTYQWRRNGVDVPGATMSSLALTNVSAADNGDYDVIVSGTCAPVVISDLATVSVGGPDIVQQPALTAPTACDGDAVTLSVTAEGVGVVSRTRGPGFVDSKVRLASNSEFFGKDLVRGR